MVTFKYHATVQAPDEQQLTLPGFGSSPSLVGFSRRVPKRRLPTNTTTWQHRVHRWFSFIAGFSPEFVSECWEAAKLSSKDTLLDPFAGCGTAPLSACQHGGKAVGFEPHPVFSRICRAKLLNGVSPERVTHICDLILGGFTTPVSAQSIGDTPRLFLEKLFSPDVLERLLGGRKALQEAGLNNDDLAFLILSRIVEKSTHSQTDGIYKAPTTRRQASDPREACLDTKAMLIADLERMEYPDYSSQTCIYEQSSEDMSRVGSSEASIIVTSPPYLNNFDYAEMTRMLLYFWNIANSWAEITDRVRSKLITNTTTALRGHRELMPVYRRSVPPSLYAELDGVVAQLTERKTERAGKKEYHALVYPYFGQIANVFRECQRCLRAGGVMHIMVADAALYGVHIATPQILASILRAIGLKDVTCDLVRCRGHRWVLAKREGSALGLGEYHVRAVKGNGGAHGG
jgi:DNA modification methylase